MSINWESVELKVVRRIIYFFIIVTLIYLYQSNGDDHNIKESKNDLIAFELQEFSVKMKKMSFDTPTRKMYLEGTSLNTGRDTCFVLYFYPSLQLTNKLYEGDTISKKSDELFYIISSQEFLLTHTIIPIIADSTKSTSSDNVTITERRGKNSEMTNTKSLLVRNSGIIKNNGCTASRSL